jgi:FAD-dependent urate hydroxylase
MTNTQSRRALVIGCGIGGPVVAMALQRAGIEPIVVEAFERPADDVGSFLNLSTNGIEALQAIDADRAVLDAGFSTPRMVMWSGTGQRLGEVANGLTRSDGITSQTVPRGLLHRALRDEARRHNIAILTGKRLVGAERLGQGVRARFADGSDLIGDLLIGADGLHSITRQLIDPNAPDPRYTGLISIGGRALGISLEPSPSAFHMIFGRRAFFGYTAAPSGEVYWFANVAAEAETRTLPATEWKDRLRTLFAVDAGPAAAIIDATGAALAAYPIFDMPAVPRWHDGPMVITGDAAHATSPSSGQGASMAMEDAIVLALCLKEAATPGEAFAAYEALRRARVERVVRYSARIGQTKSPGPVGRWIRDLCMPVALKLFANPKAHEWLYRYDVAWKGRVTRLAEVLL